MIVSRRVGLGAGPKPVCLHCGVHARICANACALVSCTPPQARMLHGYRPEQEAPNQPFGCSRSQEIGGSMMSRHGRAADRMLVRAVARRPPNEMLRPLRIVSGDIVDVVQLAQIRRTIVHRTPGMRAEARCSSKAVCSATRHRAADVHRPDSFIGGLPRLASSARALARSRGRSAGRRPLACQPSHRIWTEAEAGQPTYISRRRRSSECRRSSENHRHGAIPPRERGPQPRLRSLSSFERCGQGRQPVRSPQMLPRRCARVCCRFVACYTVSAHPLIGVAFTLWRSTQGGAPLSRQLPLTVVAFRGRVRPFGLDPVLLRRRSRNSARMACS